MKLSQYRVQNFRSVYDSGWIECDNVTTLVGINESGKSNLLLGLWKLNPASGGDIDILHDMPVSSLSSMRKNPGDVVFISAEFLLDQETVDRIVSALECELSVDTPVIISRYYDGQYSVDYPNGIPTTTMTDEDGEPVEEDDFLDSLQNELINEMPKFVYYSNYGNLSNKIYLPHAMKWLNNQQVEGVPQNEDQVRTLKVLFEFVHLDPQEILELGKDPRVIAIERNGYGNRGATPTEEEIEKASDDKEERSILLQSAGVELTTKFRNWWKQGEYKFRFEADGDYFRILVSDSKRPEEISLELRSTGLQWFLSFYLIFLVESKNSHKDAILLLDEAGLTLHPLAQRDLVKFFEGLSENNQIINTTHSPFIIDSCNIDRCRVVYSDQNGFTVASSDLRQGSDTLNEKSIYAVHAAMGLSVSDILLQGCNNVIVEGPSDQYYLNAIKTFLIREKLFAPKNEIVFIPSGGVRGIPGIVSIIGAKSSELPFVIVDSDKSGQDSVKKLNAGIYKDIKDKILEIGSIVGIENSEVEDLIPIGLIKKAINKRFANCGVDDEEVEFIDTYDAKKPLVQQIETFQNEQGVKLEKGWKVEIAKAFKKTLSGKTKKDIDDGVIEKWIQLFKALET